MKSKITRRRFIGEVSAISTAAALSPSAVITTGIAGGLISPKRALLLASLKGIHLSHITG